MPCSTVMSGKEALLARADEHVAEIQMIGRHVDRNHRLGALPAIDGEFLRQKAEHESARRLLDQHDALEPVLVVRRERDDQLLDRRVDRAEDRHAQQIALGPLQQPLADDVGRERPDQQHDQRRRQDAETRHVRDAELPARAAATRRRTAPTKPSISRKIQMNAATLMTSGTVTKKPAMKLRRSHCIGGTTASAPQSLANSASPSAIRYQANGAKPSRLTTARNGLTTSTDAMNAITNPTAISSARSDAS